MNLDEKRLTCARTALERIPPRYWEITAEEIVAQPNGHAFHHGMHIGWAWVEVDGHWCLDFLSEQRIWGIYADRFFPDGSVEQLEIPHSFFKLTADPELDRLAKQELFTHNRRSYKSLRDRGSLPPVGENFASQEMNESLASGIVRDLKDVDGTES